MLKHCLIAMTTVIACVGSIAGQDKPKPTAVSGKIDWVFDYEKGKRLSLETGKPMFVVIRCER